LSCLINAPDEIFPVFYELYLAVGLVLYLAARRSSVSSSLILLFFSLNVLAKPLEPARPEQA
jgi:hypothetical protein